MELLQHTDFSPHVGTVFIFSIEGEVLPTELTLKSATLFQLGMRDGRVGDTSGKFRAPFSLLFEGVHEPYIPQGNYSVKHPGFPEGLEIFMTPIGKNDNGNGYLYEAVYG